jgi:hypothetical protein
VNGPAAQPTTGRAPAALPLPARLPLLAGGALALLTGLYAGLLRLDAPLPGVRPALADVHGPVMVLGFVGTLVALERAVALRSGWALLAPACSAAGAAVLVVAGPGLVGNVLLATAAVGLLAIYHALWRRQPGVALLSQAAGAAAWYAAVLAWLAGAGVAETAAWLTCFVVATIAGERLELAHVAGPTVAAQRWFLAALAALIAGAAASTLWYGPGYHLFGAALLAMLAWLVRHDVARRTVRGRGLVRYAAIGLLAGYAWLGLAGVLWAGAGPAWDGPRYDATLHAVFLGFTMSMIFVHAPVILPAVLRRPLPYHPVLYAPLALLHASLLARVVLGDALAMPAWWRWSGVASEIAIVGFLGCAAALAVRGRRRGGGERGGHRAGSPAPARGSAP